MPLRVDSKYALTGLALKGLELFFFFFFFPAPRDWNCYSVVEHLFSMRKSRNKKENIFID